MTTVADVRRMLAGKPPEGETAVPEQVTAPSSSEQPSRRDFLAGEVAVLAGVGHLMDVLLGANFRLATHIAEADIDDLTAVPGIGKKTAEKLQAAAKELLA